MSPRRELNFVHALRDRDNHQKTFERRVDSAIQGEQEAQHKLYQAEAEFEAKNWGKRKRDHSFQEINKNVNLSDFKKPMGRSGSER